MMSLSGPAQEQEDRLTTPQDDVLDFVGAVT